MATSHAKHWLEDPILPATLLAVGLHLIVIFGVGFELEKFRTTRASTVTFALTPSTEIPDSAQHIAQENQQESLKATLPPNSSPVPHSRSNKQNPIVTRLLKWSPWSRTPILRHTTARHPRPAADTNTRAGQLPRAERSMQRIFCNGDDGSSRLATGSTGRQPHATVVGMSVYLSLYQRMAL